MAKIRQHKFQQTTPPGFILIAVLWVTMLLSVFALNYATTSRLGAQRAIVGERLIEERRVLLSALAVAEHDLGKYLANQERLEQEAEERGEPLADLFYPRYEPRTIQVHGRDVQIRAVSQGGRLDVNALSAEMLERVVEACGVPQGAERTGIVNSILDWIDPDDLRRAEGAESQYYMALEHPYPAKNAPVESIEELLLVKGIDADLFRGGPETPGLIDFLGASGQTDRLDVNSAPPWALALVPGLREETRDAIRQARAEGRIQSMSDLALLVDPRDYELLLEYFDVLPISRVTIEVRILDPDTGRAGRPLRRDVDARSAQGG